MIRLFAAIHLPEAIGRPLLARQAGIGGAGWRPLEAFHVTLRFCGELTGAQADEIEAALAEISSAPFDLQLSGVVAAGQGEGINSVRALVVESEAVRRLARDCERAARRAGLAPDDQPYAPHVTLAYLSRPDMGEVEAWLATNAGLATPVFPVKRFGLYSSRPTPDGSAYRLERDYPLDG